LISEVDDEQQRPEPSLTTVAASRRGEISGLRSWAGFLAPRLAGCCDVATGAVMAFALIALA
jgi:hypothetical protein